MTPHIAVVGAGLIGRAWAIVFARAGHAVRLYDPSQAALEEAHSAIQQSLADLVAADLLTSATETFSCIQFNDCLTKALEGTLYVQECGPEQLDVKRDLYQQMEALVAQETILASSTSGISASHFSHHLSHPQRCLVAHPVNPPYLIPLVEVVPSPLTSEQVVESTMRLLFETGQQPVLVRKEVQGFVLNRLQGALLNEAMRLLQDGVISAEDLDKTVKHGLGLRWSFMGPLETIDLNAPGGICDYAKRYGPLYQDIDRQRSDTAPWHPELLATIESELRQQVAASDLSPRQQWRDQSLMALISHQRTRH
ncbi:3-hydroxyacyl-CoA dehydrogenase [Halomonas binhaiensis]|uniref:3-hydroxyacyl-CoA dehydrogenase n=1 Tax=Halomonas binhaiensis TaxID=2562282 RepID=A0A5C1NHC7_9GAMM|nr:3-hydroxyacyl-CoA dehydrogenase [Halomonas binhaiensis]QEM82320.1 3-hydroxyacyl-CoA dehydrogenase [Halomonas binhaiensis]